MARKGFALLLAALMVSATPAFATTSSDDPEILFKDGKFFGEVRYRYEHVEQGDLSNEANAHTVRTNLGFKTGIYKDFQAAVEFQVIQNVGEENFNDTVNGNGTFPVVADPDAREVNQFWLSWSGLPQTKITLGRQPINHDDQRFIGTIAWRQNDQSFDALTITNKTIQDLDLSYSYVSNVNRIFGDDSNFGDLDSEIHLARASYKVADWMTATGYGYWLDFDRLPLLSSQTAGLRLTGWTPITDNWDFVYEAEAATQSDYENNPTSYDEEYFHFLPGIRGYGFTLKAGYEELGGDGTNAFQTPLATAHKFNGWADLFLNTPGRGLQDSYLHASYKASGTNTFLDGTNFVARYHEFEADSNGDDFGSEFDWAISKKIKLPDNGQPFKDLNVLLKYADFESDDPAFPDTQRVWLQLGVKF